MTNEKAPSKVLLAALVATVIIAGIAYATEANDRDGTAPGTPAPPAASPSPSLPGSATADPTASWTAYEIPGLSVQFRYPPTWGTPSATGGAGTAGHSVAVRFGGVPGLTVSAHTADWTKPVGGAPFAYFTSDAPGSYWYHRTGDGASIMGIAPTRAVTTAGGQAALIVGGTAALELDGRLRGQSPAPSSFRYGFVDVDAAYLGERVKGVAFAWDGIPASEETDFDLAVKSLKQL